MAPPAALAAAVIHLQTTLQMHLTVMMGTLMKMHLHVLHRHLQKPLMQFLVHLQQHLQHFLVHLPKHLQSLLVQTQKHAQVDLQQGLQHLQHLAFLRFLVICPLPMCSVSLLLILSSECPSNISLVSVCVTLSA